MSLAFIGMSEDAAESPDDHFLYRHLLAEGIDAKIVDWKTLSNTFSDVDLAVVRSPYDYTDHLDDFLAAMDTIEKNGIPLCNPSRVIRWNSSKRYLADLDAQGARIVPSVFSDEADTAFTGALARMLQHSTVVIKPMVGAGGAGVHIVSTATDLEQALSRGDYRQGVIAQRFFQNISEDGEYSLIFFGGAYSHTIHKKPATGNFLVQEEHGGVSVAAAPSEDLIAFATAALEASARCCDTEVSDLLYARVDILPDNDGTLYLSEIELIEPQLFFEQDATSVERLTHALSQKRQHIKR